MKPTLVADEMFPEGAGPYVELEEVMLCMYSSNEVMNIYVLT